MAITASQVKELREKTDAGMMACKKALTETDGNFDAAIELLRKKGEASAGKKAERVTAEGLVTVKVSDDGKQAVIVEVNCETDFVAREAAFIEFNYQLAELALSMKACNVETLSKGSMLNGNVTVEDVRQSLISKIGENIQVRRVTYVESAGVVGQYMHMGGRIGVLVNLSAGDLALAKDLAMHVAASNPVVVNPEDVPADEVAKEKEIFSAQAAESGKPAEIIEKMVSGRINKFVNEVSLMGQPFVKDPNMSVAKLLASKNAKIDTFVRFEVGEGIEKVESDFVAEVKAASSC